MLFLYTHTHTKCFTTRGKGNALFWLTCVQIKIFMYDSHELHDEYHANQKSVSSPALNDFIRWNQKKKKTHHRVHN